VLSHEVHIVEPKRPRDRWEHPNNPKAELIHERSLAKRSKTARRQLVAKQSRTAALDARCDVSATPKLGK